MLLLSLTKCMKPFEETLEGRDRCDHLGDFSLRVSHSADELTAECNHSITELDNGDDTRCKRQSLRHM